MVMDPGLERKYQRLKDLLGVGNIEAPHIQTEIGDVLADLKANGERDSMIMAHVDPERCKFTRTKFHNRFYYLHYDGTEG